MIGPGRFIAVVGPSGAGKDSLIRAASAHFADDPSICFPSRLVTRPPSPAEDNIEIDADAFATLAAAGGFALSWSAHGHLYGLPIALDDHVREGRDIVCNISRAVIPLLRRRYAASRVVEVTASPDILRARLGARARDTDGPLQGRLARVSDGDLRPDVTILNEGSLDHAVSMIVQAIRWRMPPAHRQHGSNDDLIY